MMTPALYMTLAALITLLSLAPEPIPGTPLRCSISVRPGFRARAETVLLATGSSDSAGTGAGTVVASFEVGHSGSGEPGPIYGQRFEVARFGGADSARLARAYERLGDTSAIIVPWDYDPGCSPTRWARSAAWVPPSEAGTFTVALRAESLWVNGVPVFDAFIAAMEPYPLSPVYRGADRFAAPFRTTRHLSADEYFELVLAMPTRQDQWETPDAAWRTFLRWRDAHPDLAELYPANQAADHLASDVRFRKALLVRQRIDQVIAGTWRMTMSLDAGLWRQFYLRTRAGLIDEWHPVRRQPPTPPPDPLEDPPVPEAYSAYASGGASLETLSTNCRTDRAMEREGYVYVIDPPRRSGESRREWRGWLEPRLIARQFPGDSALARFQRADYEEWKVRRSTAATLDAPARFWLDDGGTMRVEQTLTLKDGRALVVLGERVSSTVITCEI